MLRLSYAKNNVPSTAVSKIVVLPNPAKNSIKVNCLDASVKYADIFDVHGKKVMTIGRNNLQHTIDISQLCNGMYHLVVHGDNGEKGISFSVIK